MIELHADTDACGFPSIRHYFAWTGSELKPLVRAVDFTGWKGQPEPDGTILTFKGSGGTETIIWPGLGAPDGYIIKMLQLQDLVITGDSEGDYEVVGASYATEIYHWDGSRIRLLKQDPAILDWYDKFDW